MNDDGFYLMHRGWMDNSVFDREPYCKRSAWAWLIERAAWKPCRIGVNGKPVALERGQLSYSVRYLADAWGWHRSKVERFVAKLIAAEMISVKIETGQSVITVCNYSLYQDKPESGETGPRQDRDGIETGPRQIRTSKQDINSLRSLISTPDARAEIDQAEPELVEPEAPAEPAQPVESPKPTRAARKTQLPSNWELPPEWAAKAAEIRRDAGMPPIDIPLEAARFRDHWVGTGKPMADWLATWRNWVRNSKTPKLTVIPGAYDAASPKPSRRDAAYQALFDGIDQAVGSGLGAARTRAGSG